MLDVFGTEYANRLSVVGGCPKRGSHVVDRWLIPEPVFDGVEIVGEGICDVEGAGIGRRRGIGVCWLEAKSE